MVKHFPEHIDPYKFARQGENLSGRFDVARMKRLAASLDNDSGNVEFELIFDRKKRASIVTGKFNGEVKMICQRCLNQVNVPIQGEIHLEFVVGEEAEARLEDEGYDMVVALDEPLSLLELIEDEALLELPFSPLHEKGECSGSTIVETLQESARPNPFAVLANLKKDQE